MSRLKLYWISQHGSCPGEESLPGSIRRVLRGHSHLSDESYPRVVLVVKNPPASAGDIRDGGSIPGLGRSPGGGHDNPLQYSCLENSIDEEPGGL